MSLDESKLQTIAALRQVLDTMRNDAQTGKTVQRFEQVLLMLRELESGSLAGWDPLMAARSELNTAGKWLAVKELAKRLHLKDVQAPGSMNKPKRQLKRRPLTNLERLERILLQAANHGRLRACKCVEDNLEITLVGMNNWSLPPKTERLEPRGENAGRKPRKK